MIKGSDRKEGTKVVQFRASSEYSSMLELIINLVNKKIEEVGSDDKLTTTDVIKLAIESLVTGNGTVDILGHKFSIKDLIEQELSTFSKGIDEKIIRFEVGYAVLDILKELLEFLNEKEREKNAPIEIGDEIKEIESLIFTREGYYDYLQLDSDEKEAFGTIRTLTLNGYLDIIKEKYNKYNLNLEYIDYEKMKNNIEDAILSYNQLKSFPALKLIDNYTYSLVLTKLRKEINTNVQHIEEYLLNDNDDNPFTKKEEGGRVIVVDDDYYDDFNDYDYDYDEFNINPGDPDYEFSMAEALDNMYDR